MKITASKIKRELVKKGRWDSTTLEESEKSLLIKDVLSIINEQLKAHKGISIK